MESVNDEIPVVFKPFGQEHGNLETNGRQYPPETFIRTSCIALIVFGIIMSLMQIEQIFISLLNLDYIAQFYPVGAGLWTGIYFIVVGAITIKIRKCLKYMHVNKV